MILLDGWVVGGYVEIFWDLSSRMQIRYRGIRDLLYSVHSGYVAI